MPDIKEKVFTHILHTVIMGWAKRCSTAFTAFSLVDSYTEGWAGHTFTICGNKIRGPKRIEECTPTSRHIVQVYLSELRACTCLTNGITSCSY